MKKSEHTNSDSLKSKGKIMTFRTLNIKESLAKRENGNSYIKKLEEMKDLYKKLIVKSISHNINKKATDELNRNLNRLVSAFNQKVLSLDLIFTDFYICVLKYLSGDNKLLNINLKKLIEKVETIDVSFEYSYNQHDKILFQKLVYDNVIITLNEISGESKKHHFDSFECFFKLIMSKEHLLNFSYFIGIIFNFKGNKEYKEAYFKLLMENYTLVDHKLCSIDQDSKNFSINNSVSTDQKDRFLTKLRDIVNKIDNCGVDYTIIKENQKVHYESSNVNITNNQINEYFCPKKTLEKRSNTSAKSKISNYQKYIKNLKSIKEKIVIIPNNNNDSPELKENKYSLELKLNRKRSSGDLIIPSKYLLLERDDSISLNLKHHSSSTKDFSNISKNKINMDKSRKTYHLPIFGGEENSKALIKDGDNLNSILEKIDLRLNDFENYINVFDKQMKLCKELLK